MSIFVVSSGCILICLSYRFCLQMAIRLAAISDFGKIFLFGKLSFFSCELGFLCLECRKVSFCACFRSIMKLLGIISSGVSSILNSFVTYLVLINHILFQFVVKVLLVLLVFFCNSFPSSFFFSLLLFSEVVDFSERKVILLLQII